MALNVEHADDIKSSTEVYPNKNSSVIVVLLHLSHKQMLTPLITSATYLAGESLKLPSTKSAVSQVYLWCPAGVTSEAQSPGPKG